MWESRVLRRAFERLELHEGKLSRAVLRGGGGGDVTSLPDPGWATTPVYPARNSARISSLPVEFDELDNHDGDLMIHPDPAWQIFDLKPHPLIKRVTDFQKLLNP